MLPKLAAADGSAARGGLAADHAGSAGAVVDDEGLMLFDLPPSAAKYYHTESGITGEQHGHYRYDERPGNDSQEGSGASRHQARFERRVRSGA
jgi:hypothetical protein